MAFWWWNRRRKWYFGNRYRKQRRRKYKPRRRRFRRRRTRRATRRRRRRRTTKVRRKKQYLRLLQWQPDSIRKCKIKSIDALLIGANGKQFRNYTTAINDWTTATTPGGGGFSTAVFSLDFLYEQYKLKKCIWTTSNENYDLCRYTGSRFHFYRHPIYDFVVVYQRQYPFTLNFQDYMSSHPYIMLQAKHKIIIPSMKYKPQGKRYISKKIKPPKQMTNKWFFQDQFSNKGLVLLKAAVCDLSFPYLGMSGNNELATFYILNIYTAYEKSNWGQAQSQGYSPYGTYSQRQVKYTDQKGTEQTMSFSSTTNNTDWDKGWFAAPLLLAKTINFSDTKKVPATTLARYNPKIDTGKDNYVWLSSISTEDYNKPLTDKVLIASGQPLWLLLFGFTDYVKQIKRPAETLSIYFLCMQSPALIGSLNKRTTDIYVPIDQSFIQGKNEYSTPGYPTHKWYPTILHQMETINNIVKTGPFIPKPDPKYANWELHYKSSFFFKWGGASDTDKRVTDPAQKSDYIDPNTLQQGIQVSDPKTQIPQSLLHTWDYRRGLATPTAIKRISEYLPFEHLIPTDSEYHSPHKQQKLSTQVPHLQEEKTENINCLQQLYEESTSQEEEETSKPLIQLIQQQHKQQHHIKRNLLLLLTHLKRNQLQMQLQSGIIE